MHLRGTSCGALILALMFVGALPTSARPTTSTTRDDSSTKRPGHVETDHNYEAQSADPPSLETLRRVAADSTEGLSPAGQQPRLLGWASLPSQYSDNGGTKGVVNRATVVQSVNRGLQAAGVAEPTAEGDSTYQETRNVKKTTPDGKTAPEPASTETSVEGENSPSEVTNADTTVEANKVTSEPSKVEQVSGSQELVTAVASLISPQRPAAMVAGGGKPVPPELAVFADPNYGFAPMRQPTELPYDLGYIRPDFLGGIPQIKFPFPAQNVAIPSDADGFTTYKPLNIAYRMKVDKIERQNLLKYPSLVDKARQIVNAWRQILLHSQFGNNVNSPRPTASTAPTVPLNA